MLDLLRNNLCITLIRCAMGHPRGPFNRDGGLTLQDIEADEDLVPLLRCWHGEHLYLEDCPGFNDVVLDMMTATEPDGYLCAPYMRKLVIADSPNFTATALRRLVSARFPGISNLRVHGLAPNISIEERKQISQYVYEFTYDPLSS
jgi:hypothetical protein